MYVLLCVCLCFVFVHASARMLMLCLRVCMYLCMHNCVRCVLMIGSRKKYLQQNLRQRPARAKWQLQRRALVAAA